VPDREETTMKKEGIPEANVAWTDAGRGSEVMAE
jgi:hypothetical protein